MTRRVAIATWPRGYRASARYILHLNHHQSWETARKAPVDRPTVDIICYAGHQIVPGFLVCLVTSYGLTFAISQS